VTHIQRRSPVVFDRRALETENRGEWSIVRRYEAEGDGPYLIDLSHRPRWDIQRHDLDRVRPLDRSLPQVPGTCRFSYPVLINRLNRTQATVWQLAEDSLQMPEESAFTDVTDATVFLALIGENLFPITQKLTALDLSGPSQSPPLLLQGPLAHVPCRIVVMDADTPASGLLMTCARGYARDMVAAVLDAGASHHLRPAGEAAFESWLKELPVEK
jgi:hypothetical protein